MAGLRKPNLGTEAETAVEEKEIPAVVEQEPVDTKEVAVTPVAAKEIAPAPVKSIVQNNERDDSFDGLEDELGFGSFPIVKLDKTEFVCGNHTMEALDEVILLQAKKKHLYKASQSDDKDVPLVYSYDGVYDIGGTPLTQVFAEWVDEGAMEPGNTPFHSIYMEVYAQVLSCSASDLVGELVMLNIAPKSLRVLSGYQAKVRLKGAKLSQVVTRVCKGQKVSMPGGKSFYPWDFRFVRHLPADFQA